MGQVEAQRFLLQKEIRCSEILLLTIQHVEATAAQVHVNKELATLVSRHNTASENF
jgi:hypothetical protein